MKLIVLTKKFYEKYEDCSEILKKENRPYVCLKIHIGDLDYAIPFRHHIHHKYAFMTVDECGLDYSKAVVLVDTEYIASDHPVVDQKEFNIIKKSEDNIRKGLTNYVKLYKKAREHGDTPFYENILKYSTLKYFDEYID